MITTMDLYRWSGKILKTKSQAEELAKQYNKTDSMANYYMGLVQVADAQLSLIDRLIRESEFNDEKEVEK